MGEVEGWYVGPNLYYSVEYSTNDSLNDITVNATSNDGPFTIYIYEYDGDDWTTSDELYATDSGAGQGPWLVNSSTAASYTDYIVIIGNDDWYCNHITLQVNTAGGS